MVKTLVLLILSIINIVNADPKFQFKPLNTTAGLYYHQLGQLKISHEKFTLLTYTNMTTLQLKLSLLVKVFDKSIALCKHPQSTKNQTFSRYAFTCKENMDLLNVQINRAEYKFESVKQLTGHSTIDLRLKRGIFDGASYAFKWLFGTPDAEDAKYYAEAIESVTKQNHDVQMLMKQQIHVLSDAITEHNQSVIALRINEQRINENILKFNQFSKNVTKKVNALTYYQKIQDHVNLISQLTSELNEQLDVLISAILFAKQNILHPSVITPKHLKQELNTIKLNSGTEFPIPPEDTENIHHYFSFCTLNVVVINNILIYAIKIPLTTKELYQLYNLIPLPVNPNEFSTVYSYVDPPYPYLALSSTRTYYGRMKNLNNCKQIHQDGYICEYLTTYLTKEQPVCETELRLKTLTKLPSDCNVKTIKAELEVWHPLSTNQWLYVVSKPTTASITCYDSVSPVDVEVHGTGTLTLDKRGKCYTYTTLLISSSNQTGNYTNFMPSFNLPLDDCCIEKTNYLENEEMEKISLTNINLNELNSAKIKLQQFDDILQQNLSQPYVLHRFSWANALLAALTILAVLLCFCRCCPCRKLLSLFRRCITGTKNCCPQICITNTVHSGEYGVRMTPLVTKERSQLSIKGSQHSINDPQPEDEESQSLTNIQGRRKIRV